MAWEVDVSDLSKQTLEVIAEAKGFVYAGEWDDLFHFQKPALTGYGFWPVSCTSNDISNGNIYRMMELGLTRSSISVDSKQRVIK
jgi:hypothetical protein